MQEIGEVSLSYWFFRKPQFEEDGKVRLTHWFFHNPPLEEAGRPAVGFSTIGGKVHIWIIITVIKGM